VGKPGGRTVTPTAAITADPASSQPHRALPQGIAIQRTHAVEKKMVRWPRFGPDDALLEDGERRYSHQRGGRPACSAVPVTCPGACGHQANRDDRRREGLDDHPPDRGVPLSNHGRAIAGDDLQRVVQEIGDGGETLSGEQPEEQDLRCHQPEKSEHLPPARCHADHGDQEYERDDGTRGEFHQRLDGGE
jgi:hypothetical protein